MFQFKKVRKMQNLVNVYIWGSPFVMSRTDAQNGVDIIFNFSDTTTTRFRPVSLLQVQTHIKWPPYKQFTWHNKLHNLAYIVTVNFNVNNFNGKSTKHAIY